MEQTNYYNPEKYQSKKNFLLNTQCPTVHMNNYYNQTSLVNPLLSYRHLSCASNKKTQVMNAVNLNRIVDAILFRHIEVKNALETLHLKKGKEMN